MDALWRPLKRARASISGPVQTSDKENAASAPAVQGPAPDRRKRAQSLGGPLHAQLHKSEELSPRKKARRSLVGPSAALGQGYTKVNKAFAQVPGRSILKASAGPSNPFAPFFAQDEGYTATITQSQENTSSQEAVTSSSQQSEDRRKSLARRVSFCNRVTMREFEKDQPQPGDTSATDSSPERDSSQQEAPANQLSSSVIIHADQPNNESPLKGQRYSDLFEQSMDMATDDVTGAFGAALDNFNLADEAPMTFVEDSSEPEEEQDMSVVQDPHATTAAFAHNTVILSQSQRRESEVSHQSEESEASQLALGSGDEYETPLGPPGVSYSDQSSSPNGLSLVEDEDEADESGMDMDMSVDGNGMMVSDGLTSRRISVGGTLRRGSVAPGQAALAMLDGIDEATQEYDITQTPSQQDQDQNGDESGDHTVDMDQDVTFKHDSENTSRSRASLTSHQPAPVKRASFAPSVPSTRSPGRAPRSPARSPGRAFRPDQHRASPAKQPRASIATMTSQIPHPPSFLARAAPRPSEPIRPYQPEPPKSRVSFAPAEPFPVAPEPAVSQPEVHSTTSPEDDAQEEEVNMVESSEDEGEDAHEPQDANTIGLEDFFGMCGVKFMDDVFAGGKPKSRKSLSQQDQTITPKSRPTLADQVFAMSCSSHDLNTFSTMSKELRKAMEENGEWLDDMDSMVQDDMPEIFKHYIEGTADEKAAMDTAFKTAKSFYRTEVRNEWYAYKQTAMQDSCVVFDHHQQGLDRDLQAVRQTGAALTSIRPELEARQLELQKQLEQERARETEIAQCDQEQLAGLREAIAEQETQVNDFVRDQADVDGQLERVKARIAEMVAEKAEHQHAIQEAHRIREAAGFTSAEQVASLKDRLATLETLHGWKVLGFNASELKLLYLDEISVVLSLTPGGVDRVQLSLYRQVEPDETEITVVRSFHFDILKKSFEEQQEPYGPAATLLQRIASAWNAAQRLVHEVTLVKRRYPISVHLYKKKSRPDGFVRIAARVHCHKAAASFVVMFEVTGDEMFLGDGVHIVAEVGCMVEPKYGQLDCTELSYIVRDYVSNGTSGALVAGCEAAEAKME